MKPVRCTKAARGKAAQYPRPHHQRGDALVESLVGVVIASIMGLGLAFTASKMILSQRYVATQNAVLDQMTASLSSQGVSTLCAGGTTVTVVVGSTSLALPAPTCASASVTVSAPAGALPATLSAGLVTTMSFSTPGSNTAAQNLLGGSGVMIISQ
jgi:prepilin peptidase dependent protein A